MRLHFSECLVRCDSLLISDVDDFLCIDMVLLLDLGVVNIVAWMQIDTRLFFEWLNLIILTIILM